MCRTTRLIVSALALFMAHPPTDARAHDKVTADEVAAAKRDGTYAERVARIRRLQQHRMSGALEQRAIFKIQKTALQAMGRGPGPQMAFPFTAQPELRSWGTVRTLTLLIDFEDYRAANVLPGMTAERFRKNIYEDGTEEAKEFAPYESLHAYYHRASETLVDIRGDVVDWYHFPRKRSEYAPRRANPGEDQAVLDNRAIFNMVAEALDALGPNYDFAQYDNDNDADIDLVTVLYAGPNTGWGTFWWAYRWEFFIEEARNRKFGGKRLNQFVFQFVSRRGASDFDPRTIIHETGHAFGLADYYDYDASQGAPGGVGGLDMMDGNWGNHCAFSRWLLDWIQPEVIGAGAPAPKRLVASGAPEKGTKAIAVFPGLIRTDAPSQELFLIENRHQIGNDGDKARMPSNGLLVWHILPTLNDDATGFAMDNSYTKPKLIRLVRASCANDFRDDEVAGPGDYHPHQVRRLPRKTDERVSGSHRGRRRQRHSRGGRDWNPCAGHRQCRPCPGSTCEAQMARGCSQECGKDRPGPARAIGPRVRRQDGRAA